MCSETYFTQEKFNMAVYMLKCTFSHSLWVGRRLVVCPCGPSFWQPRKGHEKCIFETLHNEIKCVLSIKESNFNEKMDQNLLTVRAEGATAYYCFLRLPLICFKIFLRIDNWHAPSALLFTSFWGLQSKIASMETMHVFDNYCYGWMLSSLIF